MVSEIGIIVDSGAGKFFLSVSYLIMKYCVSTEKVKMNKEEKAKVVIFVCPLVFKGHRNILNFA